MLHRTLETTKQTNKELETPTMSSKVIFVMCVLVAVAAAVPTQGGAGAAGPIGWGVGVPPWVSGASWYPQWIPCTGVGSSCLDCTTKIVCTKVGGLQRACTDPTLPYCNLGDCSATPAAGCEAVPA